MFIMCFRGRPSIVVVSITYRLPLSSREMVTQFTTEPPTNYYQYANETPPAGSLLVAIDEFVDRYQIGQTGDDMLR